MVSGWSGYRHDADVLLDRDLGVEELAFLEQVLLRASRTRVSISDGHRAEDAEKNIENPVNDKLKGMQKTKRLKSDTFYEKLDRRFKSKGYRPYRDKRRNRSDETKRMSDPKKDLESLRKAWL